ncbi:MAG: hypothetical protein ACKOX6_11225 [Bdellovibrio sp.]
MKKFVIARTYCTRFYWTVEAKNKKEALAKLDSDDQSEELPFDAAEEVWQGPYHSNDQGDLEDGVQRISP